MTAQSKITVALTRWPGLRRRRGSITLEAVLALPVLLILFGAVAQFLVLSQARLYVEQAAYAAARSALVHKCPAFNLQSAFKSPIAAVVGVQCQDHPQKWEDAARWALVAASSPSEFATSRGVCAQITAGKQLIAGTGKLNSLSAPVANSLCYAYEPGNVDVTVEWVQSGIAPLSGSTTIPMRATVRFKYPLSSPFRRFIYDGQRADGTYWKWGEATVVLL